MDVADKVRKVEEYMRQTTGTENWYLHWSGLHYTDGVRFVADTCGAHWLIDIIGSHQPSARREASDGRHVYLSDVTFQVWELAQVDDGTFEATAWSDTPHKSTYLIGQQLEYTDFPLKLMPFIMWIETRVLLLPREH